MREQIVDGCSRQGTYSMTRKEFDETFTGRDLTIQVRAALDFAQQNGLAFGRSMGDQHFVFSRLSAEPESRPGQGRAISNHGNHSSPAIGFNQSKRPKQGQRARHRGQRKHRR